MAKTVEKKQAAKAAKTSAAPKAPAKKPQIRRIGVLTGGGDCPGLNAVIRGVVKTAIGVYGWEVLGVLDGFYGLIDRRYKELTAIDAAGILPLGGTILGSSNKADPFRHLEKVQGKEIYLDVSDRVLDNCQEAGIDLLICAGGDGTLAICRGLAEKGLRVVCVPKTIDNDLWGTDVTIGFNTACQTATEAIDRLHTTAQSHHRVMVIELMGRYAGWLALRAGVASGGDIILIPEIPYDPDVICERVRERGRRGNRFSIVVVAEGARPKGGSMVVQRTVKGSTEPVRLGGIGQHVAQQLEDCSGIETRTVVLGHLLRGGTPSAFDRYIATRLSAEAVHAAAQGLTSVVMAVRGYETFPLSLAEATSRLKTVPLDGQDLVTGRSTGLCFGDVNGD